MRGDYYHAQYERALRIFQQLDDAHLDVAETLYQLAHIHHAQGHLTQAKRDYHHALVLFQQASKGVALNNLTGLYYTQNQYTKAFYNQEFKIPK